MEAAYVNRDPVMLVVIEDGAQWPRGTTTLAADTIVMIQQPGEAPLSFEGRVARRVARLVFEKRRLEGAVLAENGATSRESFAARRLVLKAAVRGMLALECGAQAQVASDELPPTRREGRAGVALARSP